MLFRSQTGCEALHEALIKVNASTRAGLRDGWIITELVPDLKLATTHAKRLYEATCNQAGRPAIT